MQQMTVERTDDIWTPDAVKLALEEAGKTLMMLPMPRHGRPAGYVSNWPATVQTYAEWFAAQVLADEDNKLEMLAGRNTVRIQPQQRQIAQLEVVLGWLFYIEDTKKRRIVTLRSLKHPISEKHLYGWRRLADIYRLHENTIRNWYNDGIQDILRNVA